MFDIQNVKQAEAVRLTVKVSNLVNGKIETTVTTG
jgi:hypothetical protein